MSVFFSENRKVKLLALDREREMRLSRWMGHISRCSAVGAVPRLAVCNESTCQDTAEEVGHLEIPHQARFYGLIWDENTCYDAVDKVKHLYHSS